MRRVTRDDLQRLYAPAPRALVEDIHAALADLPERREKRKVKKKMSIGFILAAVLLLLSVAAVAADKWDLFRLQTHTATPLVPLEGAEKLVETGLGSAENELVTLTVEQAAYDGQGVTVMARLTAKDAERYALFNAMLMDAPEDLYETENVPARVPVGEQALSGDHDVELVNRPGNQALYVDGEAVELPDSFEAAQAAGLPVYQDGDVMYYADQCDFRILGRRDGKELIFFNVNLLFPGDDPALGIITDGMSMDAEEQSDGSVLVWLDCYSDAPLPETVSMRLRPIISLGGKDYPLDEIEFALTRAEAERTARYVPEGDGIIGDHVRVREVSLNLTRVRAYLTIDFDYEERDDEPMGVDFRLYDGEGNQIRRGSGALYGPDEGEKLGFWRWQMEMQSSDDIPGEITLEAKVIDGAHLGRCVCRLEDVPKPVI